MPSKRSASTSIDFLPYRLSVLSNRVSIGDRAALFRALRAFDPEWRVMAVLGDTPGLSAREVAQRTAMDKVQVSRAVAGLMRAKRVARDAQRRMAVSRAVALAKGPGDYDEVVPLALALEQAIISGGCHHRNARRWTACWKNCRA